ncbi:MAG: cobyrinic acid a,c-diamide synthase, partial [Candidatus Bathyarchaeota archaeon]
MEAGVEHLGRGTARHVDAMLVVADSSIKSLVISKHIHSLAKEAGIRQIFLVGNKAANQLQRDAIEKFAENNDLNLLGVVPFDEQVVKAEMQANTPLAFEESLSMRNIGDLTTKIAQLIQ